MNTKRINEVMDAVKDAGGVQQVNFDGYTGTSHLKLRVKSRDGRERTFSAAQTPGDRRALQNLLGDVRRWANGAASQ